MLSAFDYSTALALKYIIDYTDTWCRFIDEMMQMVSWILMTNFYWNSICKVDFSLLVTQQKFMIIKWKGANILSVTVHHIIEKELDNKAMNQWSMVSDCLNLKQDCYDFWFGFPDPWLTSHLLIFISQKLHHKMNKFKR